MNITIYVGKWNQREVCFALSKEEAISLVRNHWAFADPRDDETALGNEWASTKTGSGWRIEENVVAAEPVAVELIPLGDDDLSHAVWQCPFCKRHYSEEWTSECSLPLLLRCGCVPDSKFLVGLPVENMQ